MSDTDLLFTPAVKAAALIRAKKLSPVEYVDAVLKAIDTAQPKLNCFRVVMAEEARRDAKKAEEAVMRGDTLGPLHGVPVSIKDLVDVKGVPTRHGSAIFDDNPPAAADDVLVKRLRAAGAIVVRQGDDAGVRREGPDRRAVVRRHAQSLEPRAHAGRLERRRRGGGRGGPRPAVARHRRRGLGARAGLVLGPGRAEADAGRRAATTPRAMPSATTSMPARSRRTITDAAVMHSVLVGPERQGPVDARRRAASGRSRPSSRARICRACASAISSSCANPRIAADVRANTRACARRLGGRWAPTVEEVTEKIDWIEYEGRVLYQANFAVFCAQYLPKWQNQMDPVTLAFMERGAKFTLADFRNAQFARTALFRKIQTLFERYDFLVTPTNSRTALDVDARRGQRRGRGRRREVRHHPPGLDLVPVPFQPHRPSRARRAVGLRRRRAADLGPDRRQVGRETDVLRLGALLEAGAAVGAASAGVCVNSVVPTGAERSEAQWRDLFLRFAADR